MNTQITYRFPVPTDLELEPFYSTLSPDGRQSKTLVEVEPHLLTPGTVVHLYPKNPNQPREFFGFSSRPILVLRHISPKLALIAPVVKTARRSSLFPPLLMDGRPYYLSIPNLRIVHTSRIRAVRRLGEISESSLKRLCLHINYLLALDNHP